MRIPNPSNRSRFNDPYLHLVILTINDQPITNSHIKVCFFIKFPLIPALHLEIHFSHPPLIFSIHFNDCLIRVMRIQILFNRQIIATLIGNRTNPMEFFVMFVLISVGFVYSPSGFDEIHWICFHQIWNGRVCFYFYG